MESALQMNSLSEPVPVSTVALNRDFPSLLSAPEEFQERAARMLVVAPSSSKTPHKVLIRSGHGRTAVLPNMKMTDSSGKEYFVVDVKGIGLSTETDQGIVVKSIYEDVEKNPGNVMGLQDKAGAYADAVVSEELHKLGIPVVRTLGIYKLKEILTQEGRISTEKALANANVSTSTARTLDPVLQVRAYPNTAIRLGDIESWQRTDMGFVRNAIQSCVKSLYEQGILPEKSILHYATYLIKSTARSLALLHTKAKRVHTSFTPGNICLDGALVDLGTLHSESDIQENALLSAFDVESSGGATSWKDAIEADIFGAKGAITTLKRVIQALGTVHGDEAQTALTLDYMQDELEPAFLQEYKKHAQD